ncbi:MAG: class I adenylate-forming enzyme family protein [Pseudomonadota bacterium]
MTREKAHFPALFPPSARMVDVRSGLSWTAADMAEEVEKRLVHFENLSLSHCHICVIATKTGADTLLWCFTAWSAGLSVLLINPGITDFERENIIARIKPTLWVDEGGITQLESSASVANQQQGPLGFDDPALILMTSGTTGVPKGISHTLRSLSSRCALNSQVIGPSMLAHSLCVLPVFFGHGIIGNCLTPLAAGATLYLWPSPNLAEIGQFPKIVDENAISFMSSVPTFWKLAMCVAEQPARIIDRVHVGSAPLGVSQWEEIAQWCKTDNVWNMYGMTETANWIGGAPLSEANGRDGHVGPIWGGRYAVLTQEGDIKSQGRGEVLVLSPSIMSGYHENPEQTAATFHGPWFKTGDIGDLDADGALTLIGREKFEINRAGIKVQAEEIDLMLERNPAIAEACAFGMPDPISGEAVAAAVVPAQDTIDERAIIEWCSGQVRAEAVPGRLFVVEEIARNERGKIDRKATQVACLKVAGLE